MASGTRCAASGLNRTRVVPSGRTSVMSLSLDFQRPPPRGYELEQVAMQLQDEIRRRRHLGEVRMNGVQNLPVARNLLFGAVRRLGSLGNEIADPLRRRDDALDAVRGLSAVDDGAVAEGLEQLGRLLLEQRFLPAILADQANALEQSKAEFLPR